MSDHAAHESDRVSELALSIAWHAGMTREVVTTAGERIAVVFPGHWTHGHGPDFRDAMLERSDAHLLTGAVEIHHRASDWVRHGHHIDPAYNDVVLHVVTIVDATETLRLDGSPVPIAMLRVPQSQLRAVEERQPAIWSRLGGDVCAPKLAKAQPTRIASILADLGDTRFDQRVTRFEAELTVAPPGAALVPAIFEAFGYSSNREQMIRLSTALDWHTFAPRLHHLDRRSRTRLTLAILVGLGGWMPLSPSHASLAGLTPAETGEIEAIWSAEYDSWTHAILPATMWNTARVRPANQPVGRVSTLAALLGAHGSELVPVLLNAIRDGVSIPACLHALAAGTTVPPLGTDRAIAITASVVLPFAVAYAHSVRDDALEDDALRAWATLPGSTMPRPARRAKFQVAGRAPITQLRERGVQGLLYLDRSYCGPRRCYECPIAHAVVADELAQPPSSP
jgi:hypothetical protein